MIQIKTETIKLTKVDLENFRAIAEKFNVKFKIKQVGDQYYVTASEEKINAWGYQDDIEKPG